MERAILSKEKILLPPWLPRNIDSSSYGPIHGSHSPTEPAQQDCKDGELGRPAEHMEPRGRSTQCYRFLVEKPYPSGALNPKLQILGAWSLCGTLPSLYLRQERQRLEACSEQHLWQTSEEGQAPVLGFSRRRHESQLLYLLEELRGNPRPVFESSVQ